MFGHRESQLREPGFESCAVVKPSASLFRSHCSSSLYEWPSYRQWCVWL